MILKFKFIPRNSYEMMNYCLLTSVRIQFKKKFIDIDDLLKLANASIDKLS